MGSLLETAARAVSTPTGQQALSTLLRVTGQWWLERKAPREQSITDRLIGLIEEQQRQIQQLLEGSGYRVTRSALDVTEIPVSPTPSSNSSDSPNSVATACLACTNAHLAATAAILEEAVRFARGDSRGPEHPEALRRIQTALMEITNLEREDLRPDKVHDLPETERDVVRRYLPQIRALRQQIATGIRDTDSLEGVAASAEKLFRSFDRDTRALHARPTEAGNG